MKNTLQNCGFSNLKSITAKLFLTFAVLIASQQLLAQFIDTFADGDFMSNPAWSGSTENFTVDSSRLRLKAEAETNAAYLSIPSQSINDASWEFSVRMDFNPSSTNYARIYLTSDRPILSEPSNGYFILLGNTTDDVSLYVQTGTAVTKIIDGADGTLDLPVVILRVRVTRDSGGNWTLYTDSEGTGVYNLEGNAFNNQHFSSSWFGISCAYTATRSDKFYFDDFSVEGSSFSDEVLPELLAVEVLSPQELQLTFSEEIEITSAQSVNNYSVDHQVDPPVQALLQQGERIVNLSFAPGFVEGLAYLITVSGIMDHSGNTMVRQEREFFLTRTGIMNFKEVIITEIFADPLPSVGLPEVEFLEIHNRSESTFSLKNWKVTDESSVMLLPDLVLAPGEFIILTSDSSAFGGYGKVWGSSAFPTLNNSGDLLMILGPRGEVVDSLYYSVDWYKEAESKDGGWSLELIDPENICGEDQNWTASEDPMGGTPGKQNSVFANKPDLTGPALRSATPISSNLICLNFDEKLQANVPSPASFAIQPHRDIASIRFADPSLKQLLLEISDELVAGIAYSVTVNSLADCAGNPIVGNSNTTIFGLPESASPSDVSINEILFDPWPTGMDFIEIVNTSSKFLNLKGWTIANIDDDTIRNSRTIAPHDFLLRPGEYLALTEDTDKVKSDYPRTATGNILTIDDMPPLNDDGGSVAISSDKGDLIDAFHYSKAMHSIFIKDPEGTSLERIEFNSSTNDPHNWKSCSTTSGHATPGFFNSNSSPEPPGGGDPIQIDPEAFIPVSGQPDFVQIRYKFDQGGYVANVKVLDSRGRSIKHIANNEILGTEGMFRWDGDQVDGSKARIGYYMVMFEVFDSSGKVKTFLKRVAVATRF